MMECINRISTSQFVILNESTQSVSVWRDTSEESGFASNRELLVPITLGHEANPYSSLS